MSDTDAPVSIHPVRRAGSAPVLLVCTVVQCVCGVGGGVPLLSPGCFGTLTVVLRPPCPRLLFPPAAGCPQHL